MDYAELEDLAEEYSVPESEFISRIGFSSDNSDWKSIETRVLNDVPLYNMGVVHTKEYLDEDKEFLEEVLPETDILIAEYPIEGGLLSSVSKKFHQSGTPKGESYFDDLLELAEEHDVKCLNADPINSSLMDLNTAQFLGTYTALLAYFIVFRLFISYFCVRCSRILNTLYRLISLNSVNTSF